VRTHSGHLGNIILEKTKNCPNVGFKAIDARITSKALQEESADAPRNHGLGILPFDFFRVEAVMVGSSSTSTARHRNRTRTHFNSIGPSKQQETSLSFASISVLL